MTTKLDFSALAQRLLIRARTRAALTGGIPGATVIDAKFLEGTT